MSSTKNIAKNTIFLYFRMMLIMGVSLFTSRIVLQELGVSDYGIYSLVGGFIGLFIFLNTAMSAATQRYLTFDLGKNDSVSLQKTFSATLTIHFGIALIVFLIAESFGLWYVNYKMIFPADRLMAVNVVYQFSIAAALLSIIQVPYNSLIIAHEEMKIYAYVGIAEAVLKLAIVIMLIYLDHDKLIAFAILTFLVALGIRLFYQFYCRRNYKESLYVYNWDTVFYKELIIYSGWNLFGNLAIAAKVQGSNLLLNFFYSITVNAAYGIMSIVNIALNSFVSNFQTASYPQIVKLYAAGEMGAMEKLMNQTTKFSFYLTLILIAPIFFNINYILKLWLVNFPDFSAEFIQVILMCSLVDVLSKSIMTGITATGKIKTYHVVIGLFNLLIVPVSYFLIKTRLSNSPIVILYVWFVFSVLSLIFRVVFAKILLNYNLKVFFFQVLFPTGLISVLFYIIGFLLKEFYPTNTLITFILQSVFFVLLLIVIICLLGVEKNERYLLIQLKDKVLKKIKK